LDPYDNIFDLNEAGLLELKKKFPFSTVPDLAINKKAYQTNGNISIVKILELVNKTNNSGLAIASIVGLINEKNKKEDDKTTEVPQISGIETDEDKSIEYLNEGIATEQLAKIYLQQGLKKEAIEIYKKISLQNKKKIIYLQNFRKSI
jgi:hypothetical protein